MSSSPHLLIFVLFLVGFDAACRGRLPPTEPHRVTEEGAASTSTKDAPILGSLAGDGVAPLVGRGGTSVLPEPPGPGPAGSAGAGGSFPGGGAGGGIR